MWSLATLCVVSGHSDQHSASSVPIYQTATFKQPTIDSSGLYDYSRSGNPTRSAVEAHLAKLMKAEKAFVISSGMSALDVILRLVKSGQEVIAGLDVYGGTNRLLAYVQKFNNVIVHHIDTTNIDAISAAITPKTRLILLESPTNPLMRVCDIVSICKLKEKINTDCHSLATDHKLMVCVDNTIMSPYLMNPLDLGADIVYHSGTKYLSGHHDLMAGVIGVKSQELSNDLYHVINATGCGLGPFECFLLQRGMKTLALRMEQQQKSALLIAEFLIAKYSDLILTVNYPGLTSHPQHLLLKSQSRGSGGVLSFTTGSTELSKLICDSCKLFSISVSFGCVNSLISMPCLMSHASIPQHVRKERELPEDLVRVCVGIEDTQDLIDDLEQAIQKSLLVLQSKNQSIQANKSVTDGNTHVKDCDPIILHSDSEQTLPSESSDIIGESSV